ncbi:MAG: TonB family protein [Candidatus Aminicenantales bacterium]
MTKKCFFLGSILGLALWAASFPAAENITIQVHLFKGAWGEDHPGLKDVTVMTAASHPALEALKAKVGGSEAEMTAAAIDALLEAQGLKTVDDIFAFAVKWDGNEPIFGHNVLHKSGAFQFAFSPKYVSPQNVELLTTLSASKQSLAKDERSRQAEAHKALLEGRLEKILDIKLSMEISVPVIIGIPTEKEPFFLMILLTRPERAAEPGTAAGKKSEAGQVVVPAPRPLHTVMPAYPEDLRRQGVRGQVEIQAAVDEKGNLMGMKVTKSLHPYLDFAAVQALRQWKYEPAVQGGKRIPVIITQTVNFDPEIYRLYEEKAKDQRGPGTGESPSSPAILAKVLEGSAEYCRKLAGAALDFICEEMIREVHYSFATEMKWAGIAVAPRGGGVGYIAAWIPQWDPQQTKKYDYTCDYLFVKRGGSIEERRIILKDSGRKMPDRSKLLEEKRFTALNPLMAAIQILDRDRQPQFNFRLIDADRAQGRKAYVIEAIPKSGNTWGVEYAKIWIDQQGYQILKSEIQGVPLEGYDDVLKDTTQFNIKPILTTTHTYQAEKNGVFFPARTTIRVDYPQPLTWYARTTPKLKIEMEYDKYKFFTVETEGAVKK